MKFFNLQYPLFEEAEEIPMEGSGDSSTEETEETEETSEESSNKEDDLEEQEIIEAKNLYKLLKDPTSQKDVLRVLAAKAGILKDGPPETPKEIKEAKRDLKAILKDGLGDNYYHLLGDKLEKVLTEVLSQEREEFNSRTAALEQQRTGDQVERAFKELAIETKGESNKFKQRMVALADEIYPSPTMSVSQFIKHLYTIASAESKGNSTAKQIADKINRNASNASERISNGKNSSAASGRNMNDAPKGLKNIVAAAMESLSTGKK